MRLVPSHFNFAIATVAMAMLASVACVHATPGNHETGVNSLKRFQELVPSTNEVVGMTGFYGQDQPDRWLILVKNSETGGFEEHSVNMDGVEGKRQMRPLPGQDFPTIPINVARLNVDSDMAFRVAESIAFKAKIEYDSVHYQLRSRRTDNEPVWMINMLDPDGRSIGCSLYFCRIRRDPEKRLERASGDFFLAFDPAKIWRADERSDSGVTIPRCSLIEL